MKSKLIPKNKLWISISMLIVPVIFLIVMKFLNYPITIEIAKAITSFSFLGMFLLFVTKWTKEDGDEMHLKFRLVACVQGIIYGIGYLVTMSVFELFGIESMDFYAHTIIGMVLLWMLYCLGVNIYKVNKESKNID